MELGKRTGSARGLGCDQGRLHSEGNKSKGLNEVRVRANHVMSREEHPK